MYANSVPLFWLIKCNVYRYYNNKLYSVVKDKNATDSQLYLPWYLGQCNDK